MGSEASDPVFWSRVGTGGADLDGMVPRLTTPRPCPAPVLPRKLPPTSWFPSIDGDGGQEVSALEPRGSDSVSLMWVTPVESDWVTPVESDCSCSNVLSKFTARRETRLQKGKY